jgi:hypothetical protein
MGMQMQLKFVNKLIGFKKAGANGDIWKTIEESLCKKPFSLATFYLMLTQPIEDSPIDLKKSLLEKCLQELSLIHYAKLKLHPELYV